MPITVKTGEKSREYLRKIGAKWPVSSKLGKIVKTCENVCIDSRLVEDFVFLAGYPALLAEHFPLLAEDFKGELSTSRLDIQRIRILVRIRILMKYYTRLTKIKLFFSYPLFR